MEYDQEAADAREAWADVLDPQPEGLDYPEPSDDMDGDHASALASAGFGTDEDYGCFDSGEDY